MTFDDQRLSDVFDRSGGQCHLCRRKLSFRNYGSLGSRGAWEVDHSNPQANGGTHRLGNLYPACISCNRGKGKRTSRSVRAKYGYGQAPLSTRKRAEVKAENTFIGATSGAMLGLRLAGPPGFLVGGLLGALFGSELTAHE